MKAFENMFFSQDFYQVFVKIYDFKSYGKTITQSTNNNT